MTVYDKDFIAIHWLEDIKAVHMEWKKFARGDNFKEALNTGLKLIIDKKTGNWIADMVHLGTVAEEDQKWSNEDWFPRALQGGVKNMALIMPKSVIASMSVSDIMNKVEGTDLVTHYFDNLQDAKKWIVEQ